MDYSVDNMDLLSTPRTPKVKLAIEAIAAILVILLFIYVAYSVSRPHGYGVGTTTIRHVPPNATVTKLVSQLNYSWNTTEINSTAANTSYNMVGSIGALS